MIENKDRVSYQAFLQEIENWEMTFHRYKQQLKNNRALTNNKFTLNTIDTLLTQIQSELIRYRKVREKVDMNCQAIIQQYNILSKSFMGLMDRIGDCCNNQQSRGQSFISQQQQSQQKLQQPKKFLQQTYTFKISKEPIKPRKDSRRNSIKQRNKQRISASRNKSTLLLNDKKKLQLSKFTTKNGPYIPLMKKSNSNDSENDLWDIRYQLKEIKSMMCQIQNQIKYHNHDELELQMSRVQHNNKKLLFQLKALKEDNQIMLANIQNIKQQIVEEKHSQMQFLKKFDTPHQRLKSSQKVGKSRSVINEEVSDWVKIRL